MNAIEINLQAVSTIVFDIGGVLVRLEGLPFRQEWLSGENQGKPVLPFWHHSSAVVEFESGRLASEEFASAFIEENSLNVEVSEFLDHLEVWPNRLFDEVPEMLDALSERYRLATLSNSNPFHWPRMMGEMGLEDLLHDPISSHQIGIMKPDVKAFEKVLDMLGCEPQEVLFLDDLQLSVDAAKSLGIQSVKVTGTRGGVETARSIGLI